VRVFPIFCTYISKRLFEPPCREKQGGGCRRYVRYALKLNGQERSYGNDTYEGIYFSGSEALKLNLPNNTINAIVLDSSVELGAFGGVNGRKDTVFLGVGANGIVRGRVQIPSDFPVIGGFGANVGNINLIIGGQTTAPIRGVSVSEGMKQAFKNVDIYLGAMAGVNIRLFDTRVWVLLPNIIDTNFRRGSDIDIYWLAEDGKMDANAAINAMTIADMKKSQDDGKEYRLAVLRLKEGGTYTVNSGALEFTDEKSFAVEPFEKLELTQNGYALSGQVKYPVRNTTYVLRTYLGSAKGDTSYLVSEDTVVDPKNLSLSLPDRGALAPTGEYYVTSFLMTEKTFTLADGSTKTALMPVGNQCFDTPISYTNINQPDAPASVDLTPAGNEVMRANWSVYAGSDGSFEIPGTLDGNQNTRVLPLQAQDSAGNLSTPQFALVTRRGTTYNVTFDGNGGTPSVGSMTTTGQKLASLPSASRIGSYRFEGCYTAANGGTEITTSTVFSADTTVYAHWTYTGKDDQPDTFYTINVTAGKGGTTSPSGSVRVREGGSLTLTITPDKGYVVSSVKIDGKSVGAVKSYTLTNVMGSHAITVTFRKAGSPVSGDSGGLPLWNALLCASAFGLACAVFPRRKRRLG